MSPSVPTIRASHPDGGDARIVAMIESEFPRLSASLADLTAEVIKLTAALMNHQALCNVRMQRVDEVAEELRSDVEELKEGRAENTQTHLKAVEAERDRLQREQSAELERQRKERADWVRAIVLAIVAFALGILTKVVIK